MKKTLLIIISIILLILIVFGLYFYIQIKNPASREESIVIVEIVEDESTKEVAKKLEKKGIIKNSTIFTYCSLLSNKHILPGIYYLNPNMKITEILEILDEGKVSEKKVTILEGWRREQIAQKLSDELIVDKDKFLEATKDIEGYLFPDTYHFGLENTADKVIKKFTDNFKEKIIIVFSRI